MDEFVLVKPAGRRRLWKVEGYYKRKLCGTWSCDSEAIAREVLKRLKKGKAPDWVAHDLRHQMKGKGKLCPPM